MNVVPVLGAGGLRLPLGTRVTKTKHARRRGNPYPPEMHETACTLWLDSGNAALRTPTLDQVEEESSPVSAFYHVHELDTNPPCCRIRSSEEAHWEYILSVGDQRG